MILYEHFRAEIIATAKSPLISLTWNIPNWTTSSLLSPVTWTLITRFWISNRHFKWSRISYIGTTTKLLYLELRFNPSTEPTFLSADNNVIHTNFREHARPSLGKSINLNNWMKSWKYSLKKSEPKITRSTRWSIKKKDDCRIVYFFRKHLNTGVVWCKGAIQIKLSPWGSMENSSSRREMNLLNWIETQGDKRAGFPSLQSTS